MLEREFYIWQVRTFTVRLALDLIETLGKHLKDRLEDRRLHPAEEHGGLLFGRVIDINNVEVTGFECIPSKHQRGASYDLGDGERCGLERYVKGFRKRRGPKPVGYFRTHLRPGLFLDQSDFALMTESFSDIPGIALAIHTDQTGPWNAGLFFWEDGDIDRSQTELMFPFDAAKLRVRGPVEYLIPAPTIASRASAQFSKLRVPLPSLIWGAAIVMLFLALAAGFNRSAQPSGAPVANSRPSPAAPPVNSEAQTASNTLAAANRDVSAISSNEPDQTHSSLSVVPPPPLVEPSFGRSESQPAPLPKQPDANTQMALNREPAAAPVESVLPPQKVSPPPPARNPASPSAPAPVATAPQPAPAPKLPDANVPSTPNKEFASVAAAPALPDPPVSLPAAAGKSSSPLPASAAGVPEHVAAHASVPGSIAVDVSLEPKEPTGLKRIAGHVPLLDHLHPFRNETGNGFVSARPAASIKPRVPSDMLRGLPGGIAVDVRVSIDKQGTVKNTEITRGAETQLATLAAATVRSVPWEPAHSGDRNVAMDVVVHYRFNTAE